MGDLLDNFVLPEGAVEDIRGRGLTEVPLDDGVSRLMSGHDKGVAYRFNTITVYNKLKSDLAGYECFDEQDVVEWIVDRRSKPVEFVRFLPEELLLFNREGECIGGRYAEDYKRFKEGGRAVGLPINKWGVLSDAEAASLAADAIYTVEQFAARDRAQVASKYPDTFVDAYDRAVQYAAGKEVREHNAEQTDKLAKLAIENSELQARLEQLEASLKMQSELQNAQKPECELLTTNEQSNKKGKRR